MQPGSKREFTTDHLRELSRQIATDPDSVRNLDIDEATALRKYLNPLGNIVTGKKLYVNMSIVNWRDKYLRKLHMTSLIGYLYRTLEEYEPTEEEILYAKACFRTKNAKTAIKLVAEQFLNRNLKYNPDKHLRAAHDNRNNTPEEIKQFCETAAAAPAVSAKLDSKPDLTYKYTRDALMSTYQAATSISTTLKAVLSVMSDPGVSTEDKQGILLKNYQQLCDIISDMKKVVDPISCAETLHALKIDPPTEVFYNFDRYLTNNYEHLRTIVEAFYNEKPDVEYAVILYDAHKTAELAEEYRRQHDAEFRTEVFAVENSAVNLIGPFKENRSRVEFYSRNTEILKRMMEQLEADHKLGKDLMEKQVRVKKRKNIEEAGPDEAGLAQYEKTMNIARELGAKRGLTIEEQQKLAEAKTMARNIKEDYEVPDDAIQVDMYSPQEVDGQSVLVRSKFYTQAERPLHLQENSAYVDKYQPIRPPDSDNNDKCKS